MPLKHKTETWLVIALGIAIALTGVLVGSLPDLPEGLLPWATVLVLTLAYPLALYGLLRRHRADYAFRALHFAPMVIALLWAAFQVMAMRAPMFKPVAAVYAWGFGAIVVCLSLLLIAVFCLHVIRRRVPRVSSLIVLCLLFLFAAVAGERARWDTRIASVLWNPETGLIAFQPGDVSDPRNLNPSSNPDEEEWRRKMRAMSASSASSASSIVRARSSSSVAPVAVPPKRLPQSGAGMEVLAGFLMAGYCSVLHARARKRVSRAKLL